MDKKKIKELIDSALESRQDLFLVDFTISEESKILVRLDGDNGVTVNDCVMVSKGIDNNLDREVQDFSLEVMSYGITSPLIRIRQYEKNIGRKLIITLNTEEEIEGTLMAVNGEDIKLEWKAREPKPIGKGKCTVVKKQLINIEEIREAKVQISF